MISRRSIPQLVAGLVCCTFAAALVRADPQADCLAAVERAHLGKTQYGLYAVDLDANRELVSINADGAFMPASNMKVVTTGAALATLGPGFTFKTELRLLDKSDPGAAVVVVKGDGDPSFGDSRVLAAHQLDVEKLLGLWVKAVKDSGVTKIATLVVDDRIFDYTMTHPTWPANQLNSWYCAEVSGLAFNDNCLDVYATPGAPGSPARIDVIPAAPFLSVTNSAVTGSPDSFHITRKPNSNELVCSGTVHGRSIAPIWVTVHDPAAFFAQVFAQRLGAAGVTVGAIRRPGADEKLAQGTMLHTVQTPLPTVLERCLKDSQNLFAESLFKRVGYAAAAPAPGSWEGGAKAVTSFLVSRAGVKEGSVTIVDGSGMSRDNRVTPKSLVQVLTLIHRDPALATVYRDSLSIAGRDGTLEKRLKAGMTGQVYGKTGYIAGVSALSGYLVLPAKDSAGKPAERTIAFSLLFNQVGDLGGTKALEDQLVRVIDADMAAKVGAP